MYLLFLCLTKQNITYYKQIIYRWNGNFGSTQTDGLERKSSSTRIKRLHRISYRTLKKSSSFHDKRTHTRPFLRGSSELLPQKPHHHSDEANGEKIGEKDIHRHFEPNGEQEDANRNQKHEDVFLRKLLAKSIEYRNHEINSYILTQKHIFYMDFSSMIFYLLEINIYLYFLSFCCILDWK